MPVSLPIVTVHVSSEVFPSWAPTPTRCCAALAIPKSTSLACARWAQSELPLSGSADWLRQRLPQVRHECLEMCEVDVVPRAGYCHHLDARVFASQSLGRLLGYERRFGARADHQCGRLHFAYVLPGPVGIVRAAAMSHPNDIRPK